MSGWTSVRSLMGLELSVLRRREEGRGRGKTEEGGWGDKTEGETERL